LRSRISFFSRSNSSIESGQFGQVKIGFMGVWSSDETSDHSLPQPLHIVTVLRGAARDLSGNARNATTEISISRPAKIVPPTTA